MNRDPVRMHMARGGSKTTLVPTGGGSNSVRSTVPMWLVSQFGLQAGDKLEWKVGSDENGELFIKVIPQG